MNTRTLALLGAGLVAALPSVAAAAPAWCGGATFDINYDLGSLARPDDPGRLVQTIVKGSCSPNNEAKAAAAKLEAARREWSAKLGMNDADWADAVAYTAKEDRDEMEASHWAFTPKDLASMSPLDQYRTVEGGFGDGYYSADVLEPTLTEVGRLAIIENCAVSGQGINIAPAWAICQTDIKRWDPVKFSAQLRSDTTHSPSARMGIRFRFAALPAQLTEHAARVAKLVQEDKIYQQMFDAAEAARAEWTSTIGTHTDLLALVASLDAATFFGSRSGFDGCEAKAEAALRDAVGHLPAKTFAKMMDVKDDPVNSFGGKAATIFGNDPLVHLASSAFVMCEPYNAAADYLMTAIADQPGARGPRNAAITKIIAAKLVPDKIGEQIQYPRFGGRSYTFPRGAILSYGGVIKSITSGADGATITFAKETIKQENCVSEHRSTRVDHMESNGSVIYESVCDKSVMETIDRTPGDRTIEPAFAKTLKPGQRVSLVYNQSNELQGVTQRRGHAWNDKRPGAVIATWANKAAALPNTVLGAPVK